MEALHRKVKRASPGKQRRGSGASRAAMCLLEFRFSSGWSLPSAPHGINICIKDAIFIQKV